MLCGVGRQEDATREYLRAAESDLPHVAVRAADRLARQERWRDSIQVYERALAGAAWSGPGAQRECMLGMALARWRLGDQVAALSGLGAGGPWRSGSPWRYELVAKLAPGASLPALSRLRQWVLAEEGRCRAAGDAQGARDAGAALLELARARRGVRGQRPPSRIEDYGILHQLVLEGHPGFFPEAKETAQVQRTLSEVQRMLSEDLPQMRGRVREDTGVELWRVRIRPNERLPERGFRVLVEEVPVQTGTVGAEPGFAPDGDACRRLGISGRPVANPHGGGQGRWLSGMMSQRARRAGLEVWDRYRFMVAAAEGSALRNLERFVGLDGVAHQLDRWVETAPEHSRERRVELRDAIRARADGLLKATRVMKALARERVRPGDADRILALLGERETWTVGEIVEEVRRKLGARDLGADAGAPRLAVPLALEERLARAMRDAAGAPVVALSAGSADALRGELGEILESNGPAALVVRDERVRPFVKRLIEPDWPATPVLRSVDVAGERPAATPTGAGLE
jgi:hypothetical protein